MAHAGGKPRKWKSAKALAAAVEEYFSQCKEEGRIPSVAGLALSLGFMSRQALERYTDRENEDNPDEYVVIITRAKLRIEEENIQLAYNRDASPGARFVLQNGFNYTEKQTIDMAAKIVVDVVDSDD